MDSLSPSGTAIEIGETEAITFSVVASDLNEDILSYLWKLDGENIGNEETVQYESTYEDSGSHTIKVTVSDGIFDTEKIWSVTVNNLNRKPELEAIDDIVLEETDTVVIKLDAYDDDGDVLTYGIDDERFIQDGNTFTWETTYDDAGEHLVTIIVSDGVDSTSQEVSVTIYHVPSAPVILDIIQK